MKKYLLLILILISSLSYGQSWLWGRESLGGDEGFAVGADNKGNAYVTGDFQDTMIYGVDTLKSKMLDMYLAKYDKNGNFLWAQQSHCTSANLSAAFGGAIATDKSGNVYLGGWTRDTVYFGANMLVTPAQEGTAFIAKYDVSGNLAWIKQGYAPTFTCWGEVYGITCDKNNNVFITGGFGDTITFASTTLKTPKNKDGFFLVKYDSNGNQIFAKQNPVPDVKGGGSASSVYLDSSRNIYLTGNFYDSMSIGSYILNSPEAEDFFICKYDTAGNVVWAKQGIKASYNYNDEDYAASIVVDQYGNSFITGEFIDTLLFGVTKLTSPILTLYIIKFDRNGNPVWAKDAKSLYGSELYGYSLAISDLEKIFLSGSAGNDSSKIQMGTFTIKTNNIYDGAILFELDTAGNVLCGSIAGTGGDDQNGIACDPLGEYVFFGGDGGEYAIFGNDTLQQQASWEPSLVARWLPCGETTGVTSITKQSTNVLLYPNPNNGIFTVSCHAELVSASQTIGVYNMLGENIYNATLKQVQGDNTINLNNQPNGIYLYRVISENGNLIGEGKLVIQK